MKFKIKHKHSDKILFSGYGNSFKSVIELAIKSSADLRYADLSSADLSFADLRYADLRSADLRSANLLSANLLSADLRSANLSSANLRFANLRFADLRSADLLSVDLRYANLRSADLRYAKTDKRYLQIFCIGSRKDGITYCFEDDIVWCKCWYGSLKDFKNRVKKIHAKNKQYLTEYLGAINYIERLK